MRTSKAGQSPQRSLDARGVPTRHARAALGLVVVVTLAVIASQVAGARAAGPQVLEWVALGDSYSAGVGHNGGAGLNTCKRQGGKHGGYVDPAEALLQGDIVLEDTEILQACIGAEIDHYWTPQDDTGPGPGEHQPQREHVTQTTDVVTMTFGGNDLGFADFLHQCGLADCSPFVLSEQRDLDALFDDLVAVYLDVRERMAPNGHLFVLTYPQLFSDPDNWRNDTCEGITRNEGEVVNAASQALADTIFQAVQRANEGPGGNVHFVDVIPRFENRGLCRTDFESLIRGASADRRESFHPSSPGYQAMGGALARCMRNVFVYARRCDQVGVGGPGDATGGVVSALAIDSSGSMSTNDPDRRRIDASKAFVTASIADDRLSVVDFDSSATLRASRLSPRAQRLELNDAIDAIGASGGTNIGAALQSACDELAGATGSGPRVALLFTDGQGGYQNQASCFADKGWPVHIFGLGSGVNDALLQQIADETGGTYKPLSDVRNLVCEFQQVRQQLAGGLSVDCEATGTINPGQTIELLQPVAPNTLQQTFTVTRPSAGASSRSRDGLSAQSNGAPDIQMSLRSPSGRTITRATTDEDVVADVGPTHESIAIEAPEAGDWEVELLGVDVPAGQEYKFSTVGIDDPSNEAPVPAFSVGAPQSGTVSFDATESSDPDGEIVSYQWYFSDGATASGSQVSHPFTEGAEHSVTLVVTDDAFESEALTKSFGVPAPESPSAPEPSLPDSSAPGSSVPQLPAPHLSGAPSVSGPSLEGDPAYTYPAKLRVGRARVLRRDRRLDVFAPLTSRAFGEEIDVEFFAAQRRERFKTEVTSGEAALDRIRFSEAIPREQADLGTGIVTLAYPGNHVTRPQEVRLRAARNRADLDVDEISLQGDRLSASGNLTSLAEGVVRLELSYLDGQGMAQVFKTNVDVDDGEWSVEDVKVPSEIARHGAYVSALFTGYFERRIRGEMVSYQLDPGQTRRP